MTPTETTRPRLLLIADSAWNDETALTELLHQRFDHATVLVIANANGQEGQARAAWISWGGLVRLFYPDRARHGRLAWVRRDRRMIYAGAESCLVFLTGRDRRARDCVRAVRKAGIPLEVVTAASTPGAGERTGPAPGASSIRPHPVEGEPDDLDPACR